MRTLVAGSLLSVAGMLQATFGPEAVAARETHTVVIVGMKFEPESLTVKRGDAIVWVNKDFFPHTATAQGRAFDSRDIVTNKNWKYVANKEGTFPYICTLHPTMKGTLIVK